ncbi:basic proline-rich protein-like [Moschus berezovskii]|uniref:basic proline-rich protein-like n=1 Tax=Moschus berezovskii TaxID=68408 RepID=UPI002443BD0B|nr:basic proline-rich protein-like [Moschus berezovskii]
MAGPRDRPALGQVTMTARNPPGTRPAGPRCTQLAAPGPRAPGPRAQTRVGLTGGGSPRAHASRGLQAAEGSSADPPQPRVPGSVAPEAGGGCAGTRARRASGPALQLRRPPPAPAPRGPPSYRPTPNPLSPLPRSPAWASYPCPRSPSRPRLLTPAPDMQADKPHGQLPPASLLQTLPGPSGTYLTGPHVQGLQWFLAADPSDSTLNYTTYAPSPEMGGKPTRLQVASGLMWGHSRDAPPGAGSGSCVDQCRHAQLGQGPGLTGLDSNKPRVTGRPSDTLRDKETDVGTCPGEGGLTTVPPPGGAELGSAGGLLGGSCFPASNSMGAVGCFTWKTLQSPACGRGEEEPKQGPEGRDPAWSSGWGSKKEQATQGTGPPAEDTPLPSGDRPEPCWTPDPLTQDAQECEALRLWWLPEHVQKARAVAPAGGQGPGCTEPPVRQVAPFLFIPQLPALSSVRGRCCGCRAPSAPREPAGGANEQTGQAHRLAGGPRAGERTQFATFVSRTLNGGLLEQT